MSMRPITSGPKHHWFGYYDKLQFDPSSRYVLGMEVDFEHRSPTSEDVIRVGMIDLTDGDRWIELGETRAWCWQQGCMLQWIPGSDREIIWNDREGDSFVCHILDVHSGKKRTLGYPVYTVSPDGRTAIGADFRRINHMRPGYGYSGLPDPHRERLAPDDAGIYSVDLETGAATFLISIAQVAAIPDPHRDLSEAKHYFNHLLFNTDGSRFIFLHRCRWGESGFHTRMMTAAADGSNIYGVDQYGHTSHFIWRDPETHPGVGQASLTRGRFLCFSGRHAGGGGDRQRGDEVERALHLSCRHKLDSERYLSCAERRRQSPGVVSLQCGKRPAPRVGRVWRGTRVCRRMALRSTPAVQPGWESDHHRFSPWRQR